MNATQENLWLEYWEERNDEVYNYDAEATILASQFKKAGAKSVLSLGCGTGPCLRRLAPRGFKGTGVDRDQSLLDIGENLARKQGHLIRFVRTDIRRLPNLVIFDAAFAMHLSFPESDWLKILRSLNPLLKPGGIFVAGFLYADSKQGISMKGVSADLFTLPSGKTLVELDRYFVENTYYQCSMILIEETASGVRFDRRIINIYFFSQKAAIIDLLASQGYTNPTELREDDIGFPGLKAVLLKTISSGSIKGG